MFIRRLSHFVTLVLLPTSLLAPPARAAKTQASPDFEEKPAETAPARADDLSRELIDISPAPPPPKTYFREQDYFYPYRRAITARVGQVNSSTERNGTRSPHMAGIQFLYTTLDREHYEGGADIFSEGSGALQFGERFFFSRGRFRPYTGLGGRILVNPADGLALFVNFSNFQAMGSAGLEYLAFKAQSTRINLDLAIGATIQVVASLGYVWAW